ncbi:MAG: hypothetical protein EOP04_26785 [Proteobacteria bacterium]|nr:MAG: hypothetical protein EOP04_26785 [Pseudomonadota bacterium]
MDALALWGPFGILVESKAKQFRVESQLRRRDDGSFGDAGRLATDLDANIVDAFKQAQRALRFIEATDHPIFKEKETQRLIPIRKSSDGAFYLLTVSLLEQGGIANYRSALQEIGLFSDGISSLALTIWELDIISQFCDGPDVFLHYLERRLQLLRGEFDTFADELDHFGCYLNSRLHSSTFEGNNEAEPKLVMLSGWGSTFDLWMSYQRGDLPEQPDIQLQVPPAIREIQIELRKQNEDWARLLLLDLLGADDEVLLWMSDAIEHFRSNVKPGSIQSSFLKSDDTVWCVMASRRGSRDELANSLEARLVVEQYSNRARFGIGFGIYLPDTEQAFAMGFRRDAPWESNPNLERLISSAPRNYLLPPR